MMKINSTLKGKQRSYRVHMWHYVCLIMCGCVCVYLYYYFYFSYVLLFLALLLSCASISFYLYNGNKGFLIWIWRGNKGVRVDGTMDGKNVEYRYLGEIMMLKGNERLKLKGSLMGKRRIWSLISYVESYSFSRGKRNKEEITMVSQPVRRLNWSC